MTAAREKALKTPHGAQNGDVLSAAFLRDVMHLAPCSFEPTPCTTLGPVGLAIDACPVSKPSATVNPRVPARRLASGMYLPPKPNTSSQSSGSLARGEL